jgi:methylmalonyl-CoA mutase
MLENSFLSVLIQTFPKSNKEIWKHIASQEIDGKDPFTELSWKTTDGLVFFPYYEHEDVTRLHYLKKFRFTVADDLFHGPRKWLNAPTVDASDAISANKKSLEHLATGADGIFFTAITDTDANKLLNEIEWPYCSLFFQLKGVGSFTEKTFPSFLSGNSKDITSLTGALFWDNSPKKGEVDFYLRSTPNFKALGLMIKPNTAVVEIAEALSSGVRLIETLSDEKNLQQVARAIAFSIPVNTAFFESIAKLKALRLLWYQVMQAYRITDYKSSALHIHARSETWRSENFEPHGNMIKTTTAAMASILGGSDSLSLHAEDDRNQMMERVARNVSIILREESHLNKVADPLSGAYAIDTMVDTLAKSAWALFQSTITNE